MAKHRQLPGPHVSVAPPAGTLGERPLPFEPEPGPPGVACRVCERIERPLRAELASTRGALAALEDLLGELAAAYGQATRQLEESVVELGEMTALLVEFGETSRGHERILRGARGAVLRADRERREALARAEIAGARADRLQAESRRRRETAAITAAADDLAFATAAVADGEALRLDLEQQLASERKRAERFARYVEALEARLRRIAEERDVESAVVV